MEKKNSIKTSEEVKNVNPVVDLDTILLKEVGQFGWYQLRTIALLAVAVIFLAWGTAEYLFTAARIGTRCLIPECESTGAEAEFAPSWILNAVPGTSATSFDNCQRFANISASVDVVNGTCPAALFDRQNVVDCDEYVYENTHTVVYDFDLACDEWRRTLIGLVRTVGVMVGLPIAGIISDRWGRHVVIMVTSVNIAWLGVVRYWANTYIGFMISEVAESTFGSGGFSSSYILAMELVGPKYRAAAGAMISSVSAVGQITIGLIAWAVPDWRLLTLTLYIPQFICIGLIWLLSESVRWYMSKGRYEEAEKVLKEAAHLNGKELSEQSLLALKQIAEKQNQKKANAIQDENESIEPWLIVLVFRYKPILLRCLLSPIWWVTTTFVYYGLTIISVNITLSGNTYVNYIAVAAVEIPGFWTGFFLMGKIGRKPVLAGAFWVCAACQIAFLFIPEDLYAVALAVYLIGKFSIAMVVITIYVYTAELYPTKYRHRLFAFFSSMMGRIGSIISPLTPAFGDSLPFILFGSFALLSGLLVLLTPETLGTKFPDTMEEAANLGKQKRGV